MTRSNSDTSATITGIVGAVLIIALMCAAVSSCSGCAQPASADDRGGVSAVLQAIDKLDDDKPQESAARPQVSEPIADEHTATPRDMPKYMPPDDPPQVRRVLLFTDTSWCIPCRREAIELSALEASGMKIGKAEGMDVKIIEAREQTRGVKHSDWHRQFNITALPTFVLLVDGVETDRKVGFLTAAQIREFYGSNAPEVATQRPFSESWRQNLPREAWRVRNLVHTDCESASLALPTTVLHLKEQSIQFSDSRESRLNRWFSVYMPPGNVTHSGSTVTFSAPPQLKVHIFEKDAGHKVDDLRSIEFVPGGANFHLGFGVIPFRVK